MELSPAYYTADRAAWRQWLAENAKSASHVWLVFPAEQTGEPSLSYNDAVEEALCFGWIDSTTGHIDPLHGVCRFSPRRAGSSYSRINIERLLWLNQQGLLLPEVREAVRPLLEEPFVFPADIMAEIKKDPVVWEHYKTFSDSYCRIRVAHIEAAREQPEEFAKRLAAFLSKTRAGKRIVGFGGCDRYFGG